MGKLVTTNATGMPYPKVRQRSVDAPVTVGDVSPNADGDGILGAAVAPLASKCKAETTLTGLSVE